MLFNGKNKVESKQSLDKRYEDCAAGKLTIIDWYAELKRGRRNTDDDERSGHPKSAVGNGGNVNLKLREIADTLMISESRVFTILHESLGMRKFFSKWVPRLLTPVQKQQSASKIQSAVWRCLSEIKRIFCVGIWHPYFGTRMVFCL